MSSLKFENLKDEFEDLFNDIRFKNQITPRDVTKVEKVLSALHQEASVAPYQYRTGMLADVADYRNQFENLDNLPSEARMSLSRVDASLQRSTAIALESERLGQETMEDLAIQRERLEGARDRLEEANTELTSTSRLIRGIWMGLTGNKLFLIGIIIGELLIIGMIVYIKWFRN
ncbi:Oidioi.mRNA.OKI2018_I69.PAR.g11300.t1.cds [Oikopleura dioica]|uniref:Oidioi.mRNA.OKI2018_I69.PAR.g11300.t1.cds n=1 Tax=Oikopleura dioica TaxID=34765 RepID=A0ABN7RV20_OIKDI|nr:Oidioi.mRNA.OKI2018_I69.PAR.g11300.t1.cds [Oikopleura dioica]